MGWKAYEVLFLLDTTSFWSVLKKWACLTELVTQPTHLAVYTYFLVSCVFRRIRHFDEVCYSYLKVGNLAAPVAEWTVGGTPLTSLMDVERRHGKLVNLLTTKFLFKLFEGNKTRDFFAWRLLLQTDHCFC